MNDEHMPEVTKAEFQVLDVLWQNGELCIREIHERLANDWAYSTTKTVVDRMARKGLLARTTQHGIFVYAPAIGRPAGLAHWLKFFARQILGVDTATAVAMFGKSDKISAQELAELELLVRELDDRDPLP
jgi:BlaI family transcriptional regulator, penicillinase repressor